MTTLALSASVFTGASAATNQSATASQATKQAVTAIADAQLSVEDAKKAAFTNAGLAESDVVLKKAALDYDDGMAKYDVDFYYTDTEYEYDIDATTGTVLKCEKSIMDVEDYAERDLIVKKAAGTAAPATAQGVTEDQALEIALKHAGLTKGDISALRIHQDFDDDMGVTKYDIEFHVGAREYSYDIDTTTGDIYESEVDIDD
ncbi:MAG: PepSY domain-containing protein [Lachnospiraceae bacterium]|nr:PepSY domain-containing protein [Lachnospiraceae bacterium]